MKKRLKNINKFKLSLNLRQIWFFFNCNFLNKNHQQFQLKITDQILKLEHFYNRGINLLLQIIFFQSIFNIKQKKKLLNIIHKKIKFFFFFNQATFIIKNKVLNRILNFFRFLNFNVVFLKKNIDNLICYLDFNTDFYPEKFKAFNRKFLKKKKKNKFKIFTGKNINKLSRFKDKKKLNIVLNKQISHFKYYNRKQSFYAKKNIQYFFLLKIKYLLELQLTKIFQLNVIINFRSSFYNPNTDGSFLIENSAFSTQRIFNIPYNLQKMRNIGNQLFLSLISSFFSNNAQLIVEQIAFGLHRIRNQWKFFEWVVFQLKRFHFLSTDIIGIKFIICGKIAAGTRTRFESYQIGSSSLKNQQFSLKIDYGYISAETFTGTFGLHLWLYRNDYLSEYLISDLRSDLKYYDFFFFNYSVTNHYEKLKKSIFNLTSLLENPESNKLKKILLKTQHNVVSYQKNNYNQIKGIIKINHLNYLNLVKRDKNKNKRKFVPMIFQDVKHIVKNPRYKLNNWVDNFCKKPKIKIRKK
jgi:hypothetical protein